MKSPFSKPWHAFFGKRTVPAHGVDDRHGQGNAWESPRARTRLGDIRWVVLDTETSGLDAAHASLISIGAVSVEKSQIRLDRAIEFVLRQTEVSDTSNILIHGIGHARQREGISPQVALKEAACFMREDPVVGFHVSFDRKVLDRSFADVGLSPSRHWIDIALILPILFPRSRAKNLDEWSDQFNVLPYGRHGALADAFITAQLWLICLAHAPEHHVRTLGEMHKLQNQSRWLMSP